MKPSPLPVVWMEGNHSRTLCSWTRGNACVVTLKTARQLPTAVLETALFYIQIPGSSLIWPIASVSSWYRIITLSPSHWSHFLSHSSQLTTMWHWTASKLLSWLIVPLFSGKPLLANSCWLTWVWRAWVAIMTNGHLIYLVSSSTGQHNDRPRLLSPETVCPLLRLPDKPL